MAITGSGTQSDPYIVTTIQELYDCPRVKPWAGRNMYIEVDNDLDFIGSSFAYNNFSGGLISCNDSGRNLYVDFKGHKIDNIFICNSGGYTDTPIVASGYDRHCIVSNAIFNVDIGLMYDEFNGHCINTWNGNYSSYPIFKNCEFKIIYHHYSDYGYGGYIFSQCVLKNCVVNIDLYYTSNTKWDDNTYYFVPLKNLCTTDTSGYGIRFNQENTMFNIRIIYIGFSDLNKNLVLFQVNYSETFTNCSFFIELIGKNANPGTLILVSPRYSVFRNCFFVCKCTGTKGKINFTWNDGCGVLGKNFYDADVGDTDVNFSMVSSSSDGSMLALTTAQCKDLSYLSSEGFDTTNWVIDGKCNGYPSIDGAIADFTYDMHNIGNPMYTDSTKKNGYPVPYSEKPFSPVQESPLPAAMMSCDPTKLEGYPSFPDASPFSPVQESPFPIAMMSCDDTRLEGYPSFPGALPFRPVQDQPYPAYMMSCESIRQEGYPVFVSHKPFRPVQDRPFPAEMMSCESDMIEGYPTYRRGKDFKTFGAGYLCDSIEEIEIPYSVLYISDYAFWGTNIRSVKINRHCIYFPHSFPTGCHIKPYKEE